MSKELLKEPGYRGVVSEIQKKGSMTKEEIHSFVNERVFPAGMNIFYDLLAVNIIVENNGKYHVKN